MGSAMGRALAPPVSATTFRCLAQVRGASPSGRRSSECRMSKFRSSECRSSWCPSTTSSTSGWWSRSSSFQWWSLPSFAVPARSCAAPRCTRDQARSRVERRRWPGPAPAVVPACTPGTATTPGRTPPAARLWRYGRGHPTGARATYGVHSSRVTPALPGPGSPPPRRSPWPGGRSRRPSATTRRG